MKLLLTSAGWERNFKIKNEFLKLANKNPSEIVVFLVNTATEKDKDWKYVKFHISELKKVGIKEKNIRIFNLNKKIDSSILKGFDIIYVCGGNTFHYLYKMRKINFNKEIKKLAKQRICYFGISAGSILAGPRIDIAQVGHGDKNDVKLKDLTGLKLTDTIIYPHYSKQDEGEIKKFEKQNKCQILRLTDRQALLIKGDVKEIIK